jgi:hypothetical protein
MAKRSKKRCEELPILHPHAAGIDVGASAFGAVRDFVQNEWSSTRRLVCLGPCSVLPQRMFNSPIRDKPQRCDEDIDCLGDPWRDDENEVS